MKDLAGTRLAGRYVLTHAIGVGSRSTVWEGSDEILQRPVAVRVIDSATADAAYVEQFRSQARTAARLSHPGIVSIYDTVSEPGIDAVVMEYLKGMSLSDFLSKRAPLDEADTVDLGRQVLAALDAAHSSGTVHARLQPGTIILCDDRRVKITDTGFLYAPPDHITPYDAPESALSGDPDPRTDIFAVGVVLYECLTGSLPYPNAPDGAPAASTQQPAAMRSSGTKVSPQLEAAVAQALRLTPEARYSSATDFATALERAELSPVPPPPRRAAPDPPEDPHAQRKLPALLAAALAALVVLAGLALVTTGAGREAVRGIAESVGLVEPEGTTATSPDAEPAPPESEETTPTTTGPSSAPSGQILEVSGLSVFDPPPADGTEHDALVGFAADGDLGTVWHTETYANRAFGGLKEGVGLIVQLQTPTSIGALEVESPAQGWSLSVYAAPNPAGDLAGWGDPVAGASAVAGKAQFDLGGVEAGAVLIWITDLGNAPPPLRIDIAEVTLHAVTAG